jgi:uncharacterized damage-inducible protein DinB
MREIDRIDAQLQRVLHGPAWHGPALHELLRGIDGTDAFMRPPHVAHTIHELVLHIIVWLEVVARRLTGEAADPLPEQDWPIAEHGQLAWSDVLYRLDEAERRVRETMRKLDDAALERTVVGQSYDTYTMLHGVVQHTAYHSGQIAIVKRFL